jgi:hypothetical protein
MPRFINAKFGSEAFPKELEGLRSWSLLTPQMTGSTGTYWEACYVKGYNAGSGGFYVIGGGNGTKQLVISSGGQGMSKFGSPAVSSMSQITGLCSADTGGPGSSNKAVAIGPGSVISLVANTLAKVYDVNGSWTNNGTWAPGNTPQNSYPHRCEIAYPSKVLAFGQSVSNNKLVSNKSWSDSTSSSWTALTAPTPSGDGYVKGRITPAGFAMLVTISGQVDISNTNDSGDSGFRHDTSRTFVQDVDFGNIASKWILCDSVHVFTAPNGWSSGTGLPTWTQQSLPAATSGGNPLGVVAMDLPNPLIVGGSSTTVNGTTWYGIVMTGSDAWSGFLVTKDFTNYFGVEIPGLSHSNLGNGFPGDGSFYLRFCGNRLFVFTPQGVNISGPLGVVDSY